MGNACSQNDADTPTTSPRRTAPMVENDHLSKTSERPGSKIYNGNGTTANSASIPRRKFFSLSGIGRDAEMRMPRKTNKTEADRKTIKCALQEGTVLSALRPYELEEMIDIMDVVTLKTGQEGDLTGCLCVVVEGSVNVKPDNKRLGVGKVFGQVGLFHDSSPVGSGLHALAETQPTRIVKLPGSAYRAGMEFSRQTQIKANMKLLSSIPIFSKMSVSERVRICDASQVVTYRVDEIIIREGDPGDIFYILRYGGAKVFRGTNRKGEPVQIDYKYQGDFFGEAALLQGAPRNATVVADVANTEALLINRALFNEQLLGPLKDIMARNESTLQQQMILSVPLLGQLPADKRMQVCERIKLQKFKDGEYLFRQGDLGDRLYIIKTGEVSVLSSRPDEVKRTSKTQASSREPSATREIDHLYTGQYFGERALLKQEPRMASTKAVGELEVYCLNSDDFAALDLSEHVAWARRWDREDTRDVSNLKVIKALGSGAFGKAWLAVHTQTKRGYALKALDKQMVKKQNWTSVVVREKEILAHLSPHPNVITMHNSFQSPTQLFMLMELATGGELFQLLEKCERFPPVHARFYCANVVLAIGHLHKHGIVFRDLKPENLLLSSTGYLKLIDMGFAKRLGRGEKTYTLCGTPYYLAPEMILHRGHGPALDWWTVGVLTFEMIQGDPPFGGTSEMEVYGKVTRMQYQFSHHFTDQSIDLITKLLTREPENRLGNLRHGVDDVMSHPWFYDQSWDGLLDGNLPPPYVPPTAKPPEEMTVDSRALDLSDVMTSPSAYGYWAGW